MGDIPLDRGGLFKFGNFENRKGAAKPRPLCTPLGLFLSSARDSLFLFVDLCLYASLLSAPCCADVVLFLHFLYGSLLAKCPYASIFNVLLCADIISFLHFLSDSLLARCLYSSIFNALRVAISRFESQPSRGRSVSPPAACLPSPSLHQPKFHSHHHLPAIQRSADGPKPPEQPPNLSQPNNQPGSHPKPQHHNIHTIRYNSKISLV